MSDEEQIRALLIERDDLRRLAREAAHHLRNRDSTDESEDIEMAERLEAAGDTPALVRARARRDAMYADDEIEGTSPSANPNSPFGI